MSDPTTTAVLIRDELDDPPGWWETSTGVAFGAAKLREVEDAITEALGGA